MMRLQQGGYMTYGGPLNNLLGSLLVFKGLCPKQTTLIPNVVDTQNTVAPLQI